MKTANFRFFELCVNSVTVLELNAILLFFADKDESGAIQLFARNILSFGESNSAWRS